MRVFRHLEEIPSDWSASTVSIGNFDGVHCGHQHVLAQVVERARQSGAKSMAVTFEPHPVRVLRPQRAPLLITPLDQKLAALAKTGVDSTLVIAFDKQFSSTTSRDFAQN